MRETKYTKLIAKLEHERQEVLSNLESAKCDILAIESRIDRCKLAYGVLTTILDEEKQK